jgi:hypothetical protein
MDNLKLRELYKLGDIIKILADEIVANGVENSLDYERMNFCLYASNGSDEVMANTVSYLEQYPDVTKDDEEIFPVFVVEKGLRLLCYGDYLEDVIRNAMHQKEKPTIEDYVTGLSYYLENDSFRDL